MSLEPDDPILSSDATLGSFLDAFERGTWPKAAWTHAAHVAVAGCYLLEYPLDVATARIRLGIRHYNYCVGTINSDHSGYHETLTLFWLAVVKAHLAQIPADTPRIEAVRELVAQLGPRRDLFKEYYSFDIVRAVEARRSWVGPDMKPLP
jgi:hypothetical protein